MNYLKLMSILSEADADEYGVATQKKKKDEKDDFHRSKADQAFKDMHKVDVATEKDFETLGPITTKQHDDHKGNPSSINIGDATQQSPLKKFDMGGIGKSSYRKIDKTEGQKAMPKVDDGATKVLKIKEGSNFDATKFGMPKPGEKRWKQTSLSPKEAAAKHGKENVRVQKGRLRNGDDMVEVHVESVEELDELSNDTLRRYKRYATNDEVNAVISGDKARASKRQRGKVAAGNAMYNNDQRAFTQRMKDKKMKGVNYREEVEQLDELSPKTLNSYATKAQPDVRRQSLDAAKRKRRAKGVAIARFKALRGSK